MDRKTVVAELDYIFHLIKGNFNPTALVKYLTATGKWDSHIKDMAKSHGLKLKSGLNIDKLIESMVQTSFKGELAPDQIEDISTWIKIKLFYPRAIDNVDEAEGVDLPKQSLKDIFTYMKEKEGDLAGNEGKFVNLIKSMTRGHINNYKAKQKSEGEQVLIKDIDEGGLENDLDNLPSKVDEVEEMQYKDLLGDVTKYVEKNAKDVEKKIFKLRIKHDLNQEEIGEKLKLKQPTVAGYFKSLRTLIHKYSMSVDNTELQSRVEKMMDRFKDKDESKKSSAEETLERVVARLESLFIKNPKKDEAKIASITKYISTLCEKIA